jgi:coenzyme PQQ precursor peptide PqqA
MPNREDPQVEIAASRWETPEVEVICLSCEITAYAPDGEPLF